MKFVTLFLGLLLLNLFAFVTIKLRPKLFNVKIFKPMLWNFKLSILPLVIITANLFICFLLLSIGNYLEISLFIPAHIIFFVGLLLWMLFLPNSGYLITELNLTHRSEDEKEVPIWYDIVSVLSFALSGIINVLANIVIIQFSFLVFFDPPTLTMSDYDRLSFIGFVIIFLVVLGIYMGRAIRFNSWDILHISSFLKKLKHHFSQRGAVKESILYISFNTIFFLIMYVTLGIPFCFIK